MATRSIRYEIGKQIASGGMGVIRLAQDHLLDCKVAYKQLRIKREATRARMTALFKHEYETLLSLAHPNTVRALDFGFDQDGPYYTMELLSGADLSQAAPLPWRAACSVLRDVASALALVHARKLLHRDVSPNNVRVLEDGGGKLLDFGALAFFGAPRDIAGTPPFMAPECVRAEPLDQRSDLFSLGALAYWTLTQRVCFKARALDELEDAWLRPYPAPSSIIDDIPRELDELIRAVKRQQELTPLRQ